MKTFISDKNCKLSIYLSNVYPELSYGNFRKLLRNKDIKINGKRVKEDVNICIGDEVVVYFAKEKEKQLYSVIYEDKNVLVVNKSAGITSDSLFEKLSENIELYYIHRLDRNTSGIIIFAKNKISEELLINGFKNRLFKKYYLATVYGKMPKQSDILTAYLVKDENENKVRIYDNKVKGSVQIITKYKVMQVNGSTSLLEIELVTGKMHQIRAHLAYVGHFIIGDGKYGVESVNKANKVDKQMLQAYKLTLFFEENTQLSYLNNKTFTI